MLHNKKYIILHVFFSLQKPLCVAKKMKERGNESFMRGDYFDALWKYQHSFNLLVSMSPLVNSTETTAAIHSNISVCCLKMGDNGCLDLLQGLFRHPISWYGFSFQHANNALQLNPPPQVASKVS